MRGTGSLITESQVLAADPLMNPSTGAGTAVVGLVLDGRAPAPPLDIEMSKAALAAHLAAPFNGLEGVRRPRFGPFDTNGLCVLFGICC